MGNNNQEEDDDSSYNDLVNPIKSAVDEARRLGNLRQEEAAKRILRCVKPKYRRFVLSEYTIFFPISLQYIYLLLDLNCTCRGIFETTKTVKQQRIDALKHAKDSYGEKVLST